MAPASVTSRPSSTQVMPSATTTRVWKRPHRSRSSRAGISVVTIPASACGAARSVATAVDTVIACSRPAGSDQATIVQGPRSTPCALRPCFPPAPQHHRFEPPVIKPRPSKEPRPMSSTAITWIVIGVIVVLVLWIITIYNGLVAMRQRVNQAFSDIDVQTKQRHDLIPNLVETVKGYASHERGTLEAVVQARNAAITAQSGGVAAQAAAENVLTGALRQLFALSEAYPDLKANQNFQQLQSELSDIENKIAAARRFFNNAVQEYNTGIQQFPAVLLAGSLGFTPKEFFDVGAEERKVLEQAPQVKF